MTKQNKLLNAIEQDLVRAASILDDKEAIFAMKMLQDHFDQSYHWCPEMDGLATFIGGGCMCELSEQHRENERLKDVEDLDWL